MTEQIIDYNLLVKCITLLLIVGAIILVIFKSKWGELKLKTKFGDVEMNKNGEGEVAFKKTERCQEHEGNTKYQVAIEFRRIIGRISLTIVEDALSFIIKNELHNKTTKEMDKYIANKIELFTKYYNEAFSNSKILKGHTIENILGYREITVKHTIRDYYLKIYNNHKENYNKELAYNKLIAEKIGADKTIENYQQEISMFKEMYRESMEYDIKQIKDCLEDISALLTVSFRENVLRWGGGGGSYN